MKPVFLCRYHNMCPTASSDPAASHESNETPVKKYFIPQPHKHIMALNNTKTAFASNQQERTLCPKHIYHWFWFPKGTNHQENRDHKASYAHIS